jgi:hypothetical protein
MLELKHREHDEPNPQVKTVVEWQSGAVEGQIDEAVYRLYGLTEEERKVVDGSGIVARKFINTTWCLISKCNPTKFDL